MKMHSLKSDYLWNGKTLIEEQRETRATYIIFNLNANWKEFKK